MNKFDNIKFPFFGVKQKPYQIKYDLQKIYVQRTFTGHLETVDDKSIEGDYFARLANLDQRLKFDYTCKNLQELIYSKAKWGMDCEANPFDLTKPMSVNDRNPIMSIDTNIIGTANVGKMCNKYGIKFVYISTDFVYDSRTEKNINEEDGLNPINNYGWSKLGGECVSHILPDSLILRCSLCDIPFRHKAAFDNIYRTPITHRDAAKLILDLKDETGTINIGGNIETVYNFVKKYQEIPRISYIGNNSQVMSIKLDTTKLKDIINE